MEDTAELSLRVNGGRGCGVRSHCWAGSDHKDALVGRGLPRLVAGTSKLRGAVIASLLSTIRCGSDAKIQSCEYGRYSKYRAIHACATERRPRETQSLRDLVFRNFT